MNVLLDDEENLLIILIRDFPLEDLMDGKESVRIYLAN